MLTINVKPHIGDQVSRLAQETHTDTEELIDRAIRAYLAQARHDKIRAETQAFDALRKNLVEQYLDEYVAIHQGQVIDHDSDLRTLHLRVYARLGNTPVLLKLVSREQDPELVFRSPHFV